MERVGADRVAHVELEAHCSSTTDRHIAEVDRLGSDEGQGSSRSSGPTAQLV